VRELNLVEIFWSIQGEGTHVGVPSVFVRFGECDLRCAWCDSPETWSAAKRCRIELEPGSGRFEEHANPTPIRKAAEAVERLHGPAGGLVSITGGEPLLQADGVVALVEALRRRSAPVYRFLLETHGLASQALARVADSVEVVSMDWKLVSDVRRASDPRHGDVESFHDEHERFLECAVTQSNADCYVKVVVTPATRDEELATVCSRIAARAPRTTLILQPVTPSGTVRSAPSAEDMLHWLRFCRDRLQDVRVIPQTHKSLGVL
jgi:organic radical activating enzyme